MPFELIYTIIKMYQQYFQLMNKTYYHVQYWPQPYLYAVWYSQLPGQSQGQCMEPTSYSLLYDYAVNRVQQEKMQNCQNKLSRGQKRKIKKKQLEEELQTEKKALGNLVKLERKDLIQGLQKIQQKQKKIKDKKKDKLSHLIQIHKEIFKYYRKRDGEAKQNKNRRVNVQTKKKRLSYIKKMKETYQQHKNKKTDKKQDDGWVEDESGDDEPKLKKSEPAQSQVSKIQETKQIQYNQIGKLTGTLYKTIRLRQWVKNCPNDELQDTALKLINRLAYKQAIRKVQRPDKAKKLIVSGIKECKRTLRTIIDKKRSKLLIVALNVERNPLQKGVDDQVQNILFLAQQIKIPIIHISKRSNLGRAFTGKFGPRVTMTSIINFQGYQDMVEQLLAKWKLSCEEYDRL